MFIETQKLPGSQPSLAAQLDSLDRYDRVTTGFGDDIDRAHRSMFRDGAPLKEIQDAFLKWIGRYQPCLFARLGARRVKGVEYDICWITTDDLERGDRWVSEKIQTARRQWKDRAAEGLASGFLIVFHDARLAWARPGAGLVAICRRLAQLYLVEHAPISPDTIYTEAVPYRAGSEYGVLKAGVNLLYTGAHRTLNHDRRIPGGLVVSVNSPGHLALTLSANGTFGTMADAVQWIYDTAMASVGNGGIGCPHTRSTTWHNIEPPDPTVARPTVSHRPVHIPDGYSGRRYSALYQSDVMIPTRVTEHAVRDADPLHGEVWTQLIIDYISEMDVSADALNYGLFRPHPIAPEARYHNPWPPRSDHLWQRRDAADEQTRHAWQQIRKTAEAGAP